MSTPHRALPPPAGMPLQTSRESQQLREQSAYGQQPISQIQEQRPQQQTQQQNDDRYWTLKTEEHKRVQEEEKTKQENLRLEQRRIEHDMLRTSLSGGIPPHLIPMVFAGMGGGKLANASLEWTQQYIAQAQQAQQQQQLQIQSSTRPPSPTSRIREERMSQSHSFSQGHPMPAPLPSTPMTVTGTNTSPSIFVPGYNMSPASRARHLPGPSALSRGPQSGQLPRLNTNEMQILPPPQAPAPPMPMQLTGQERPLHSQQQQLPEHEDNASPQLYFHHWQPPTSTSQSQSQSQNTLPSQGQTQSQQSSQTAGTLSVRKNSASKHLLTDEETNSPRKRKATGQQQAAPQPSSQFNSPPFSHQGSSASGPSGTPRRMGRERGGSRSERGSLEFLQNSRSRQKRNDGDSKSLSVGVSPEMGGMGYGQHESGPVSARRSTLSGPAGGEREQRGMYQSHASNLREERPHYELRNSYMGGQSQDLRRELGRSEEHDREMERERERERQRERERDREMVPHHQILKRDDRT